MNNALITILFIISVICCVYQYCKNEKAKLKFQELIAKNTQLEEENKKIIDKYKDIIDIDREINIRKIKYQDIEKKINELKDDYNKKGAYYSELQKAIEIAERCYIYWL